MQRTGPRQRLSESDCLSPVMLLAGRYGNPQQARQRSWRMRGMLLASRASRLTACPCVGVTDSVTAAGEEKDGDDDEPDAVVIEKIAEAVVHNSSSLEYRERTALFVVSALLLPLYARNGARVPVFCRKYARRNASRGGACEKAEFFGGCAAKDAKTARCGTFPAKIE